MIKKGSIFAIIILIVFAAVGCADSNSPEKTVIDFIGAMKELDVASMVSKVDPANSNSNVDFSNLIDEEDQFQKYFLEYIKSNAKRISYEIEETSIDGDDAVVRVKFKYIDGSGLVRVTFGEFMQEAISLAFSGVEVTDEMYSEIFIAKMQEAKELVDESFVEKTLDINCVKVDNQWMIEDISDELVDVVTSNFVTVMQEIEDAFNSDSEAETNEPSTVMENVEENEMVVIEKSVGDEIELATINMKVTEVEETKTLSTEYGPDTEATEGAKFILVKLDITNTTKSEFSMSPDLILVDNQGREFNSYEDSIFAIDDYMDYRDLSPSIKETGYFLYELPEDSTSYFMVVSKAGTNEVYKIVLK